MRHVKLSKSLWMVVCSLSLTMAACSSSSTKPVSLSESEMVREEKQASRQVSQATEVVRNMEKDPKMSQLLQKSRGVFVVPRFGQAALGVGASGGQGILLVKQGDVWGDPAFYNFGGLSLGLQAGAEGGSFAFILNNDRAVQEFMKNDNFQLSANSGITIVNWSKARTTELSEADVVAWSNQKGLFGGVAFGLQNVRFDQKESTGFYGKSVTIQEIVTGQVKAPQEKVAALKEALSASSPALSGGSSGSMTNEK